MCADGADRALHVYSATWAAAMNGVYYETGKSSKRDTDTKGDLYFL